MTLSIDLCLVSLYERGCHALMAFSIAIVVQLEEGKNRKVRCMRVSK